MASFAESFQAVRSLLETAESILVLTREYPTDDSIGALLAAGIVLERLGKSVTLVSHGPVPTTLSFVSGYERVGDTVTQGASQFVISLDTSQASISDVSYDFTNDGNMLRICVTPELAEASGLDSSGVQCAVQSGSYDLIITLDAPDFESLGTPFEQAREVFMSAPVVNIDTHASNGLYGEVNLVDVHAGSTSEMLVSLIDALEEVFEQELFDTNVSTALLAGVMAGTRSFQRETTSSRAFTVAAQLIARGADQQRVVRSLFKNRSLAGMKLWGRVFSRITYDPASRIASTVVLQEDLAESEASLADVRGIDEELALSLPNVGRVVVFQEEQGGARARVTCFEGDPLVVSRVFGAPLRGGALEITQEGASLEALQEAVLSTLRTIPYESRELQPDLPK